MLKIDWNKAPEWAKYAAMDRDGEIWLFEEKPLVNEDFGVWEDSDGDFAFMGFFEGGIPYWDQTLTERE